MTEHHPGYVNAEHSGEGPAPAGSTTSNGATNPSDRNSLSVGPNGPLLLHDVAPEGAVGIADGDATIREFRTPPLWGLATTAPYMHDGRFETLEEVIDHYSTGIQPGPGLDFHLRGPHGAARMNFSDEEKAALVAFLHTLTDTTLDPDQQEVAGLLWAPYQHLHENPRWYRQLRLCPWFEIAMRRDF